MKQGTKIAALVVSVYSLFGSFSNLVHAYPLEQAVAAIEQGALVLDVRTQEEFDKGHVPGAVLVPYDEISRQSSALGSDLNRTIVVYCGSGNRAEKAKTSLSSMGFTHVINAGGFDELSEKIGNQ